MNRIEADHALTPPDPHDAPTGDPPLDPFDPDPSGTNDDADLDELDNEDEEPADSDDEPTNEVQP
jgi:hypothetical protein